MAFDFLAAAIGFPGLPLLRGRHHGGINHPLASLLLLVLVFGLILWAFRRKPN
jgi:hypothetical protein